MSAFYRSVQRAIAIFAAAVMMTLATGATTWVALELGGVHLPAYLVIGLVGVFVFWVALNMLNRTRRAPVPIASPPKRVLTAAEIDALLRLHEKGAISTQQLQSALGDLVPPEIDPSSTHPRSRR